MTKREEFFKRRKEIQNGFKIHLEYEYLLNTDIDWIIGEVRYAIREEIKHRKKEKKIFELTLDVKKIETGNSVDILVFLGTVVAPELLQRYGPQIIDIIIDAAWERLMGQGISRKNRIHIKNGWLIKVRGRPDGEFEIIEAEGEEIRIEE